MDYDVVVIGGGTAGVIAALQSSQAGARTLLVEKNGIVGGTMTAAGVAFPGLFHAWGRQIIGGIGWELVTRCVKEAGDILPDFAELGRHHSAYQVRVDSFLYTALCCEALLKCPCELLLHSMIASVERKDSGWIVGLCTKTGLRHVSAHILVDCTGDANACMLAGVPVRRIEHPQPASLVCKVRGYNLGTLDIAAINRAFENEVQEDNLDYTDVSWDHNSARVERWLRSQGGASNHFSAEGAYSSEGRTALELQSRLSFLRLYRFLKSQNGLEELQIEFQAQECGVRETITVVGEETITADDYVSGRLWDNAVCYCFYPIDLHEMDESGLDCRPLKETVVPTVPCGALLPKDSGGLLVAGRCISSDRLANSALRVQATCMATGQAAGALAAISATEKIDPRDVSHSTLCSLLKTYGAIVP